MKKLFTFKKLSTQITFMVGVIILIVAGGVAGYMQTRIITEIGRHSKLNLQYQLLELEESSNLEFIDAAYSADSLLNLTTVRFDIEAYKKDPASYLDYLNDGMGDFIRHIISESNYITSAYIVPHPDLAGYPYVGEIYYCQTDNGIELVDDPPTYEMYDETDPDYQWFYGAYNSGNPYWSPVYLDITGITMVSYTMPILINGEKAGVVGVDISLAYVEDIIKRIKVYDTGFALLKDNYGEFFETGDIIKNLGNSEREKLISAAQNNDKVFEISLGDKYLMATHTLSNGYTLYIAAPVKEVTAGVTVSLIRFIIIFIAAYAIVLIISYFVGKNMGTSISALSSFMRRAGLTGNIKCTPEEERQFEEFAKRDDEIGRLIGDCGIFIDHIIVIADDLEHIADGDLTIQIKMLSESDVMAVSLNKTLETLKNMFSGIHVSAGEVSNSSGQIAQSSSTLSSGSVEQSESIQELSDSIEKIRVQTIQNAEIAREAAEMSNEIRNNAEKGSEQMEHMIQAVTEINVASEQISKVIKVIDDIAFQTNILALNAAVEAARAGQHGKGFAVVAEEVRNLASKSAEAAKDTSGLIENSVAKANLGMGIAAETAESLKEIVGGINKSTEIINKIADDSHEQSTSISMLNASIEQVSQVVQSNTAAAEESAASSEEMNAQASILEGLISKFKL
ncbi:MAG: methyl-accepting chemotaxis protein [Oscillospiraceae bacterium]|nr:methyl-accepting chemotaxis protein [Oscillospiraceae bacterium]